MKFFTADEKQPESSQVLGLKYIHVYIFRFSTIETL